MAEKTIEELQAELALLKKENLKKEILAEKAKQEEAEKLKAEEEQTKLREELRAEEREKLVKEMGDESKVDKPKEMAKTEFTGKTADVRLKYEKACLNNVPGNIETLAVFNEDKAMLSSVVGHETGKELTGRKYEDIITDMESRRLFREK